MTRSLVTLCGVMAVTMGAAAANGQPGAPAGKPPQPATTPAAQPKPTDAPVTPPPTAAKPAAQPQEKTVPAENDLVYVKVSTSKGDIFLELNQAKAPITVKNFLGYVDKGFYNDTIFHRVIDKFMIQGGGYDSKEMKEKPTDKAIKNEWQNGLKNLSGTVAMARTNVPDSARAQFFINVADNGFLDTPRPPDTAAYCVFGRVVNGMDVVTKIQKVKTTTKGRLEDTPVEPVVITTITRTTREEATKGGPGDKK